MFVYPHLVLYGTKHKFLLGKPGKTYGFVARTAITLLLPSLPYTLLYNSTARHSHTTLALVTREGIH